MRLKYNKNDHDLTRQGFKKTNKKINNRVWHVLTVLNTADILGIEKDKDITHKEYIACLIIVIEILRTCSVMTR